MITSFLCTEASHAACICQGRSKAMVLSLSVLMGSQTAKKQQKKALCDASNKI